MIRVLFFAAALVLGACSGEPSQIEPYDGGPAYPSLRTSYDPSGRTLGYVANRMSDSVSIVDLDAMVRLGDAPVGRDPVDVDGPRHVVVDRGRGVAFVTLSYPLSVVSAHLQESGVMLRSGYVQALSLADFAPLGELRVDPSATELALSANGDELAVAHFDPGRAVTTPDLESRRVAIEFISSPFAMGEGAASVRKLKVCVSPNGMLYELERSRLFVACTGEDSLVVIDTENLSVLSSVPAGELMANKPFALVRDPAGGRMVLSNHVAGSVVVFDMGDAPSPVFSFYFPEGVPYFAAFLPNEQLVVPLQSTNAAALVDLESQAIVTEVRFAPDECTNPSEAQATSDGRLFLVCEGTHFTPGTILKLDPATLQVLAKVEVGEYPDRMTVLEP